MKYDMSDKQLYKIFEKNPEMGMDIFENKYKNYCAIIRKLCIHAGLEDGYSPLIHILDDDKVKKTLKNPKSNENNRNENIFNDNKQKHYEDYFSIFNTGHDEIIGKELKKSIKNLFEYIYKESPKEITFKQFIEYYMMILNYTDEELFQHQMDKFDYIDVSIGDEIYQIYDSLNILETYLFDIETGEVIFSIEQKQLISSTILDVKNCLVERNIETAKFKLVALQMLLGLDVSFYLTLKRILTEKISLYKILGFGNNLCDVQDDTKGKNR